MKFSVENLILTFILVTALGWSLPRLSTGAWQRTVKVVEELRRGQLAREDDVAARQWDAPAYTVYVTSSGQVTCVSAGRPTAALAPADVIGLAEAAWRDVTQDGEARR
jgi:hypothetical protein